MRGPCLSPFGCLLAAALSGLVPTAALARNSAAAPPLPVLESAGHAAGPSVPGAAVEPAAPLTLAAAIELALAGSPDLSAARREAEAVEGEVVQAGLWTNPELSTSVEDTRQKATRTTTVLLGQRIELGGKRSARVAAAGLARDAAGAALAARQLEVRAQVMAAFFDVLLAQEGVRLAEDLYALAQRASLAAMRRVAAGKVPPVEETRARVAEASMRVALQSARSELVIVRKRLAATWGNAAPRFSRADGQGEILPALAPAAELESRLAKAPLLARARLEAGRMASLVAVERARRVPDVTLSIGAVRAEELGRNQAVVGFSVPLPLFDRNQGNLLQAQRRADKARDELAAAEIRLSADLTQSYRRFEALAGEAEALRGEILPGARSAYEAASKGYELGKFNFLEVLDAQRTLFEAQARYLRVLAEAHRAAADIDRVLGPAAATAALPFGAEAPAAEGETPPPQGAADGSAAIISSASGGAVAAAPVFASPAAARPGAASRDDSASSRSVP